VRRPNVFNKLSLDGPSQPLASKLLKHFIVEKNFLGIRSETKRPDLDFTPVKSAAERRTRFGDFDFPALGSRGDFGRAQGLSRPRRRHPLKQADSKKRFLARKNRRMPRARVYREVMVPLLYSNNSRDTPNALFGLSNILRKQARSFKRKKHWKRAFASRGYILPRRRLRSAFRRRLRK
jgi:hypothetical protein